MSKNITHLCNITINGKPYGNRTFKWEEGLKNRGVPDDVMDAVRYSFYGGRRTHKSSYMNWARNEGI
jgi:hypothetical protein